MGVKTWVTGLLAAGQLANASGALANSSKVADDAVSNRKEDATLVVDGPGKDAVDLQAYAQSITFGEKMDLAGQCGPETSAIQTFAKKCAKQGFTAQEQNNGIALHLISELHNAESAKANLTAHPPKDGDWKSHDKKMAALKLQTSTLTLAIEDLTGETPSGYCKKVTGQRNIDPEKVGEALGERSQDAAKLIKSSGMDINDMRAVMKTNEHMNQIGEAAAKATMLEDGNSTLPGTGKGNGKAAATGKENAR